MRDKQFRREQDLIDRDTAEVCLWRMATHPGGMPEISRWLSAATPPERFGCIRPLVGLRSLCPLSPTRDATFGVDSTVGERAGVRGHGGRCGPPHPNPLPRNVSSGWDGCRLRGRGGRSSPLGESTHTLSHPGGMPEVRFRVLILASVNAARSLPSFQDGIVSAPFNRWCRCAQSPANFCDSCRGLTSPPSSLLRR